MIKVLIVDDEYHIREGIRQAMPWTQMGLQLAGVADNGKDAWDLIRERRADIVLLDINMPELDGLELAGRIRESGIEAEIVFLTGYDDFPKVRRALELQAVDYMLKPIAYGDLQQALIQAAEQVNRKRSSSDYIRNLQDRVQETAEMQAENVLLDLMQQQLNLEQAREMLDALGTPLDLGVHYAVLCAEIDHYAKRSEQWSVRDRRLYLYAFRKLAQELLEAEAVTGLIFRLQPGGIGLLTGSAQASKYAAGRDILRLAERLQRVYADYLKLPVSLGISDIRSDPEHLHLAYGEAQQALVHRSVIGMNMIIDYPMLQPCAEGGTGQPGKELFLLGELRSGNEQAVMETLGKLLGGMSRRPLSEWKTAAAQLLLFAMRLIAKVGEEERGFEAGEAFSRLRGAETAGEAADTVASFFLEAVRYIRRERDREQATPRIIEEARQWVRDHIGEDITLERIGRELHLSPNYLSALFKKTTGETFGEFTARIRFETAKQLLMDPSVKIYEVAERIGFPDANYFSIAFKKSEGLTPTQFRNRYV